MTLPKGSVKKKVEFSTKGGGGSDGQFSTKKTKQNKNMGLKHWILPDNQFLTIFGWGDQLQLGFLSEWWLKLKSSPEKPSHKCQRPISYRICFIAHRWFFLPSLSKAAAQNQVKLSLALFFISPAAPPTHTPPTRGSLFLSCKSALHENCAK